MIRVWGEIEDGQTANHSLLVHTLIKGGCGQWDPRLDKDMKSRLMLLKVQSYKICNFYSSIYRFTTFYHLQAITYNNTTQNNNNVRVSLPNDSTCGTIKEIWLRSVLIRKKIKVMTWPVRPPSISLMVISIMDQFVSLNFDSSN